MAIKSGFFNSVNGDRKYDARRFAEYFATFIGNGVFPNPSTNLQVTANDDMTLTIKVGRAWINGYILINDDDYILTIDPADGALNRIDRIVLRYDVVDREIRIEVKKGTFATTPVAKPLQRDADAYEIGIADVRINKGVVSITQANITDLRLSTEFCGIVHGLVEQVDTEVLFQDYQSWINQKKDEFNTDLIDYTTEKQQELDTWYNTTTTEFEESFNTWFATIQDILDENIASSLFDMINGVAGEGRTTETVKENADKIEANTTSINALYDLVGGLEVVPRGIISMWSGLIGAIPEGWTLCDGQNGTPDLRNRFIVGACGEYEIGNTGGEKEVQLTTQQLPSHNHARGTLNASSAGAHTHSGSTDTAGSHNHSYSEITGAVTRDLSFGNEFGLISKTSFTSTAGAHLHSIAINSNGSHSHTITGDTANAGGNTRHENRPPYFALAFIMKL